MTEEPTRDRGAASEGDRGDRQVTGPESPRHTLRQAFLTFFEIIGLRTAEPADNAADLDRFRLHHTEFRKLLSANNTLLETIADLERKGDERAFLDTPYVQRRVIRAVAEAHAMVESLAVISGDRYPGLRGALRSITAALTTVTTSPHADRQDPVLDLPAISASHADLVGGKIANLGEVRNVLGLPTPDGFAVTIPGFRAYLDAAGLSSALLEGQLADPRDRQPGAPASSQSAVLAADVPEPVAAAIAEAADRLAARSRGALERRRRGRRAVVRGPVPHRAERPRRGPRRRVPARRRQPVLA